MLWSRGFEGRMSGSWSTILNITLLSMQLIFSQYRTEHGRQEQLHSSNRRHRVDGTNWFLRPVLRSRNYHFRLHLGTSWCIRLSTKRCLYIHGGDDRDSKHIEVRDSRVSHYHRRTWPWYIHIRWLRSGLGYK